MCDGIHDSPIFKKPRVETFTEALGIENLKGLGKKNPRFWRGLGLIFFFFFLRFFGFGFFDLVTFFELFTYNKVRA